MRLSHCELMSDEVCATDGCDTLPVKGEVYCDQCDMLINYEGIEEARRQRIAEENEY